MKESTDKEMLKLTVITVLMVSMFGILQYFPEGRTFDSIEIGLFLKGIALIMLQVSLPIFSLYLIFLGINLQGEKSKYPNAQSLFYELGIFSTTFTILFTIMFFFLVWILIKIPNFPMWILVSAIWIFVIIGAIILVRHLFKKIK